MQNVNNDADFSINDNGLYAVKFSAEWCAPCKKMVSTVEKLESEFTSAIFMCVDIDEAPSIAQKYKIKALPTLLIIKDGEEVNRITGTSLIEPLRKIFRDILNE